MVKACLDIMSQATNAIADLIEQTERWTEKENNEENQAFAQLQDLIQHVQMQIPTFTQEAHKESSHELSKLCWEGMDQELRSFLK